MAGKEGPLRLPACGSRSGQASTGSGRAGGLRLRHDGFTPAKQKRFLETLAKTGCVRDACRKVGISDTSAYRTRDRLPAFAEQWERALAMASTALETVAWQRGVEGIEEPVIHYGKVVGTRIKRSDSILRLMLQGANPRKYGRMGRSGESEAQMKARLRKEIIEEEVEKRFNERVAEALSPEARRRLAEFSRWEAERQREETDAAIMRQLDLLKLKQAHAAEMAAYDAKFDEDPDWEGSLDFPDPFETLGLPRLEGPPPPKG